MDICKIVVVGDVDHGKSTLIGRLLVDTKSFAEDQIVQAADASKNFGPEFELPFIADQFEEEREKKMTMDTTQLFFKVERSRYVLIDAPGHEELLKNMFSGITQADAAILVIDINEGLKPQTRRQTFLLKMIGFKDLIVVMNKMDLVDYSEAKFNRINLELAEFLKTLGLTAASTVPVSALHGIHILKISDRMKWFKGPALLPAIRSIRQLNRMIQRPLRIPLQDIYRIENQNICVGRIISGSVKKGQEVLLLPSLKKTRIRIIKTYKKNKNQATKGENIGIIFEKSVESPRGTVVFPVGTDRRPVDVIQSHLFWLSQIPLRVQDTFVLRCVTQQVNCHLEKISKRINIAHLDAIDENSAELKGNEVGSVVLRTERPIVVENFSFIPEMGRFILEKDNRIHGVGVVMDDQLNY